LPRHITGDPSAADQMVYGADGFVRTAQANGGIIDLYV
jgi:hypothetical protein